MQVNNKLIIRKLNRIANLENLIEQGFAYCSKHDRYLILKDLRKHHCYTGNHGKTYCKYVQKRVHGRD